MFIEIKPRKTQPRMEKYSYMMPHHRGGLDETFAVYWLRAHGLKLGIDNNTPLRFMAESDYDAPLMEDSGGGLYLGCGRKSPANWANEHYLPENERTKSSTAKIVFEKLGVFQYWNTRRLVDAITHEDRHGARGTVNHIAQVMKDMYDLGWRFEKIYHWVKPAFIALMNRDWKPENFSLSLESCHEAVALRFGLVEADKWLNKATDVLETMRSEYQEALKYLKRNSSFFQKVDTYCGPKRALIPDRVMPANPRIIQASRSLGADVICMAGKLDFGKIGMVINVSKKSELSLLGVLEELRYFELLNRGEFNPSLIAQPSGAGTDERCPYFHGMQAGEGDIDCTWIFCGPNKTRPCASHPQLRFEEIREHTLRTIRSTPEGEVVAGFDSATFLAGSSLLKSIGK